MRRPSFPSSAGSPNAAWVAAMPVVFVLLWSTGFIGARLGLPHAEPFTFLMWRFAILTAVLGVVVAVSRAPWPLSWRQAGYIAMSGLLVHATYLGGVFFAIKHGVPAGVAALIVGLQPIFTALAAGPWLGEKITRRQWAGFLLGLLGVALVVQRNLTFEASHVVGIVSCVVALLGITAGTLVQKKHGGSMDLRTGSLIQYAASGVVMVVLAMSLETMQVAWTGEFIFALTWLIVVLSMGAIGLLMLLIRHGAATKVASLFYLVPPVVAVIAYFLFGETFGWMALIGMAVAILGVALVVKPPKESA